MTIDPTSGQDTETAQLAAAIAVDEPTLIGALRRSSARIRKHAGLLEAELGHYRPLVGYLENAVRLVETRTGHGVDEELFARLLDRLGITEVDLALERLQDARPNV
ncbi:MAG TPA: hypothetical protein VFA45_24360 [Actinomycetes bacterium]|jgi:hypothetical protein|nr:hypothetical protein [Actinomycetes bacterium]